MGDALINETGGLNSPFLSSGKEQKITGLDNGVALVLDNFLQKIIENGGQRNDKTNKACKSIAEMIGKRCNRDEGLSQMAARAIQTVAETNLNLPQKTQQARR